MTWKFRPNRKICPAFEQQLCYRETPIPILRCGVENWSLPTDTRPIHRCTRIYIRSTIKKKLSCFRISELRSNMQQRRSLQEQTTSCCTAAVEFVKSRSRTVPRSVISHFPFSTNSWLGPSDVGDWVGPEGIEVLWNRSQGPPFISCPLSAHWAERRFTMLNCKSGGLLPFPRTERSRPSR